MVYKYFHILRNGDYFVRTKLNWKSHCRYKTNEFSGVFSLVLAADYTETKYSQQCAATFKTQVHSLKTQATISCMLAGNVINQDHLRGKGMQ